MAMRQYAVVAGGALVAVEEPVVVGGGDGSGFEEKGLDMEKSGFGVLRCGRKLEGVTVMMAGGNAMATQWWLVVVRVVVSGGENQEGRRV